METTRKLLHGTSLESALRIAQEGPKVGADGRFYAFEASRPESLAGALCFAEAAGLRRGDLEGKGLVKAYCASNPDFPSGIKGFFVRAALRQAAKSWAKGQAALGREPLRLSPAIVEIELEEGGARVCRGGIIHETRLRQEELAAARVVAIRVEGRHLETAREALGGLCEVRPIKAAEESLKASPPRRGFGLRA